MQRSLLVNSITLNVPKNIIQFMMGVVFFISFFGMPDPFILLISCAAFLVAYSSVYVFNDICDAEHDLNHHDKRKWKMVASGLITKKQGYYLYALLIISGMALSAAVNAYFALMNGILIFLNYLHSSPKTYFKGSIGKTAVNMTIIEFIKYSVGWFAFTSNLSSFPFWIVMTLAVAYNLGYMIYKAGKIKGETRKNNLFLGSMGMLAICSYVLSFFAYQIPLSLILILLIPSFIIALSRKADIGYHMVSSRLVIQYSLMIAVVVSFMMTSVPAAADTNQMIQIKIDEYANTIKNHVPVDISEKIDKIKLGLNGYKNLDEIIEEVNETIENFTQKKSP